MASNPAAPLSTSALTERRVGDLPDQFVRELGFVVLIVGVDVASHQP